MKSACCIAILLFAWSSAVFSQATDGAMQGTITETGGKAVAGIYVIASPLGPSGRLTSTAVTTATGQFNFTQLLAGVYLVCVQMPRAAYLDPCQWSAGPHVTVTAGQVAASNIQVAKGAVLHVRVNDPGQHLAKGEGTLLLGVRGPSLFFHPLGLAANDAGGRSFDVAIPLDTALKLAVSSNHLQLADEKGAAINFATPAISVQQTAGQADPVLTFNITGKK